MAWTEIMARLLAATALGIGLGLNRYLHHKSIGVRTLGLVSVTAAALVLAVSDVSDSAGITRLVQGLVTGIGFIGAGLIMHKSDDETVHGITTAATVWVACGCGIMCGLGAWPILMPLAAIVGVLLSFGGKLEKSIARHYGKRHDDNPQPPLSS